MTLSSSDAGTSTNSSEVVPLATIPGLLAIHVRRGDFVGHCHTLAKILYHFNGFNQFDGFVDRFQVPQGVGMEQRYKIYEPHCLPSIEQIVEKVRRVSDDASAMAAAKGLTDRPTLKRLFIMTNGDQEWVEELKAALWDMGDWDSVVTSSDLKLSQRQKFVAQAIDMAIGQKAEYFIGNGVYNRNFIFMERNTDILPFLLTALDTPY